MTRGKNRKLKPFYGTEQRYDALKVRLSVCIRTILSWSDRSSRGFQIFLLVEWWQATVKSGRDKRTIFQMLQKAYYCAFNFCLWVRVLPCFLLLSVRPVGQVVSAWYYMLSFPASCLLNCFKVLRNCRSQNISNTFDRRSCGLILSMFIAPSALPGTKCLLNLPAIFLIKLPFIVDDASKLSKLYNDE